MKLLLSVTIGQLQESSLCCQNLRLEGAASLFPGPKARQNIQIQGWPKDNTARKALANRLTSTSSQFHSPSCHPSQWVIILCVTQDNDTVIWLFVAEALKEDVNLNYSFAPLIPASPPRHASMKSTADTC